MVRKKKLTTSCAWCKKVLTPSEFHVYGLDFCGGACASEWRHFQLGEGGASPPQPATEQLDLFDGKDSALATQSE